MKNIIVLAICLASSLATASQTFLVEGLGSTRKEATEDAFKKASMQYCGVALLSDKKLKNYRLESDKVTIYNSCRILSSKVLHEVIDVTDPKFKISMEITLEKANQSKRLFNQSDILPKFDNNDIKSQINSYKEEKTQGDKFIEQVMDDFPVHAFEILEHRKPYLTDDDGRNIWLIIPYSIIWNQNFLNALESTMQQFSVKKKWYQEYNQLAGTPVKICRHPDGCIGIKQKQYNIIDNNRYNVIINKMRGDHEPFVKATVIDINDSIIAVSCMPLIDENNFAMYTIFHPYNELQIYAGHIAKNFISIRMTNKTENIQSASLELVSKSDCKN